MGRAVREKTHIYTHKEEGNYLFVDIIILYEKILRDLPMLLELIKEFKLIYKISAYTTN